MRSIIGYMVAVEADDVCSYIHYNENTGRNYVDPSQPPPVSRGDAYRRLGAFMDENPGFPFDTDIVPVYEPVEPPKPVRSGIDGAVGELSCLLQNLCGRHGIALGLTDDEVKARIALELKSLGAKNAEEVLALAGR
jgi:hypothetical protein